MYAKKVFAVFCLYCISSCFSNYYDHQVADSQAVLDPNGKLLLKWQVDYSVRKIRFEVIATEKSPNFTWFAIGFSNRGEMANSDVCLYWTDYYSLRHYEDMHADGSGNLTRDQRQNCEQFYFDPTTRSIAFERLFDTCDNDDYVIEDGTVHIIWARGKKSLNSSNNLSLTSTSPENRGFIRVRLLVPAYKPRVGDAQEVAFTNNNFTLKSAATMHWCKMIKQPEFLDEKVHHIVQFESTITPGNEHLVHHMKIFDCDINHHEDIPLQEGPCHQESHIFRKCVKAKAAWAYGAGPFTYPEVAGLPIGGPARSRYLMLEIHYNNQALRTDAVDSSGLIVHISERRLFDAAIMELGVKYTDKMAIPARQKAFAWSGYCTPQCTEVGLPLGGITVFGSQLHTHAAGRAVWTRHSRQGAELRPLDKDMHFSTYFQPIRLLRESVIVLPGDSLEITCIFNTEDRENATIGGYATTDEMCSHFIHYYPATDLEICESSVSRFYLLNYFNFERRWNNVSIDLYGPPRQNYLAIQPWTLNRVETLHSLYTEFPIAVTCNKSDGTAFQGDWKDQPIPKIVYPFPELPRDCPNPATGFLKYYYRSMSVV